MSSTGIRIFDHNDGLVSVELQDIFEEIEHGESFYWSILFFHGTGQLKNGLSIEAFEEKIEESERGLYVKWNTLNSLMDDFWDVYDILIIGCKNLDNMGRYRYDKEMCEACDIVIKMFDSSFWDVFSQNENFIKRLVAKFKDVEFLTNFDNLQYIQPNPHQHGWDHDAVEGKRKRKKGELLEGWKY